MGRKAHKMRRIPAKSLAVLIKRKQERIIPKNSTVIQAGDNITLSLPAINLPDEL